MMTDPMTAAPMTEPSTTVDLKVTALMVDCPPPPSPRMTSSDAAATTTTTSFFTSSMAPAPPQLTSPPILLDPRGVNLHYRQSERQGEGFFGGEIFRVVGNGGKWMRPWEKKLL
jgi:hypothetical protein